MQIELFSSSLRMAYRISGEQIQVTTAYNPKLDPILIKYNPDTKKKEHYQPRLEIRNMASESE